MTDVEDRLRRDLPDLAGALLVATESAADREAQRGRAVLGSGEREPGPEPLELAPLGGGRPRPRHWLAAVAAVAVVAGAVGVAAIVAARGDGDGVATAPATTDAWGTWEVLPEAPITDRRAYPVAAWTGEEVVVWAGTNLARNWAETDGAAYDPATDSWREMAGPGWGHPGLAGTFLDGQLYVVAKGGGSRFAPGSRDAADLPEIDGMYMAAAVATDHEIWVLGPASTNPEGQPDLAIARLDTAADTWERGPVLEGRADRGAVQSAFQMENTPLWTGTEIVVWADDGQASAFDPASRRWRDLPDLAPPSGAITDCVLVATDAGLVALARIEESASATGALATLADGTWTWSDAELPAVDLETDTVAGAGEWLMVIRAEDEPIAVHAPSGTWHSFDSGPIGGLQAPAAVWTGEKLVVWGGVATSTTAVPDPAAGTAWTPPELDG